MWKFPSITSKTLNHLLFFIFLNKVLVTEAKTFRNAFPELLYLNTYFNILKNWMCKNSVRFRNLNEFRFENLKTRRQKRGEYLHSGNYFLIFQF